MLTSERTNKSTYGNRDITHIPITIEQQHDRSKMLSSSETNSICAVKFVRHFCRCVFAFDIDIDIDDDDETEFDMVKSLVAFRVGDIRFVYWEQWREINLR